MRTHDKSDLQERLATSGSPIRFAGRRSFQQLYLHTESRKVEMRRSVAQIGQSKLRPKRIPYIDPPIQDTTHGRIGAEFS
jgi:hypothetical protein